jgi:tRNA dimethylallyltransferase
LNGPVLVVAGPTASGKSALAIDAAEAFRGTVINGDSMQVYRELRVLTARPSEADLARVPHRLFGIVPAAEPFSVGRWLELAHGAIQGARAEGRLPIVVGGTGMYLKALTEGLAEIPDIPAEVRTRARARFDEIGGTAFHAELATLDPEAAARLARSDRQRLIRAYEVAAATGRTLGEWQRAAPAAARPGAGFEVIALMPDRETLYAACDARFERMIAGGALDEVRALDALGLDAALPAMKALGVPELLRHVRGEIAFAAAREAAQRATRNYAKRQLTWLRHQFAKMEVINAQYSKSMTPKIFSFIRNSLLTTQR